MKTLIQKFKAARNASVPLVAIQTPDPFQTMRAIYQEYKDAPIVRWDCVRGAEPWNKAASKMLAALVPGGSTDPDSGEMTEDTLSAIQDATLAPVQFLLFAERFAAESIIFFLQAHRFITMPAVAQAIWNLRDKYKTDRRTLVPLAPALSLPDELKNDVFIFDEPLPSDEELEKIVVKIHKAAKIPLPESGELGTLVDAVAGLAAFPAENSAAMAMTSRGMDREILGAQKRQQVSGIPGAALWPGKETFSDVVGCRNIVSFLRRLLSNSHERIRLIFFLDELEKMVAGTGDTSGTSQAMNEQFLSWSQNSHVLGIILLGIPGAGKSLIAKASAGEKGLPCFSASLSKVKGSLVGESERNASLLFKTADALAAGGRTLMIATCNNLAALTPEMQARFRLGTYFFDYPDQEQREALWGFYRQRFEIEDDKLPESTNWVGREIESCCELSHLLDLPLASSASRIVPVCQAKAAEMERLRSECSGRFISADYEGVFKYAKKAAVGTGLIGEQTSERRLDA